MQVGFVRSYAAIILLGAFVVLGYFIYYGLKLIALSGSKRKWILSQHNLLTDSDPAAGHRRVA